MTSIGIGALGEPVLADLLEPLFGGPLSHGIAVAISVTVAYLLITSAAHRRRRARPQALRRSTRPRASRGAWRGRCASSAGCSRRSSSCSPRSATGSCARSASTPTRSRRRAGRPRSSRRSSPSPTPAASSTRARPGCCSGVFHLHEQEARQVMTPIPAVVTVDISEDVETALRRCISSGHTRLLVTEDENQDRVKGTVHSNSLARKLMAEGPQRVDRGPRQGRPRSSPRPSRSTTCWPTCSASAPRWPSSSTSTAASPGS